MNKKPNILFIMSDDHAAQAISAYGHGINHRPYFFNDLPQSVAPMAKDLGYWACLRLTDQLS
jgi:arylsulfatase A-like enzyme